MKVPVVRSDGRAQSGPIGLVLVLALVIGSTTVLVTLGAEAVTSTQDQLRTERVENAMAQFDSEAALVALGQSNRRVVDVGGVGNDGYRVRSAAGWMNVSAVDTTSGDVTTITNATMGAVVYDGPNGERIAYQGGGVWRSDGVGNAVMVSPPEFHYRNATLTLPLVTVRGDDVVSDSAAVTRESTTKHFPTDASPNPLQSGRVTIEVKSEYHEGWRRYFERRAEGHVDHYPGEERVELTLTVPVTESFENAVSVTESGSSAVDPPAAFESIDDGVTAPSASFRIEQEIDDCESGACQDLDSELTDETIEAGTYFRSGDYTIGGQPEYDTSAGDVEVVVDGDLEFGGTAPGPPGTENHAITGGGNVTFYVRGDVSIGGNTGVNSDGDAEALLVLVHSDGGDVAAASGTPQFTGLIYAPNASLEINGGGACGRRGPGSCDGNVVGSVIARNADGGGNGYVAHDGSIDTEIEFESSASITYLHVSENRVEVTDE